jgi:hypothetical protein
VQRLLDQELGREERTFREGCGFVGQLHNTKVNGVDKTSLKRRMHAATHWLQSGTKRGLIPCSAKYW